uniref:DNA-directed RNA polymerase RpoA/D/Rpb3-type domain-containing protein n=1 Tax=viral metagenome TaxID=1070528 RepID=A0A6C0ANS0_9ZZZZ
MEFTDIKVNSLKTLCTFRLAPIHVAYANTLRRLVMTGVETIGFRAEMTSKGTTTDVQVKANDTPMTNEMFAHRIGLIPIHVKNPIEFEADQYTFTLSVTANPDSMRDVTCADFKVTKDRGEGLEPEELDPLDFFKPHPITKSTCLLATLPPGTGKIELVAKASKGTGREHARFQPTSQCSYIYTKDEDEERQEEYFVKWLREAKKLDAKAIETDKPKYDMYLREFNTMEAGRVFVRDEAGNPNSFDFTVRSVGVLDVPYIISRACDVGIAMVGKYVTIGSTTDPKAMPDDLEVVPSRSMIVGAYDFLLKGHDHTLGNLLQTWLSENNMNAKEGSALVPITYVGYEVPHPLRDEMVVRIAVPSGDKLEAQKAFAQACSGCAAILTELRTAWNIKANPGATLTLKRKPVAKNLEPVQAALQEAVAASVKPQAVPENLKPVQAALTEAVASSAATGQRKEALKRKKVVTPS